MRIAIISKSDSYGGGASRVAEQLTMLLNRAGHEADHFCQYSGKGFNDPHRHRLNDRFNGAFAKARDWSKKLGFPDVVPFELTSLLAYLREKSYDLLHFHDLSSAISPLTLRYLSHRMPVVWTLHDCSGFTGGCLMPIGCERFKTGCGMCPQLGIWPIDTSIDNSRLWCALKKSLHAQRRIRLTAPSQWIADMAFSSGMLGAPPDVISNGVNTDLFAPRDKSLLRGELDLPAERMIVLLSSSNVLEERKGMPFAFEALRRIRDRNPFLLVVGRMDQAARGMLKDFEWFEAGYIGDPAQLARTYGAADALLFCSLADNQPLTILESMAAGTPTIGFRTGGIPEIVLQEETGFLVPTLDMPALTQALRTYLDKDTLARWGAKARERAVAVYSQNRFLDNHLRLYREILDSRAKKSAARPHQRHSG